METELTILLKAVAKGQRQPNGDPTAMSKLMMNAADEIDSLNDFREKAFRAHPNIDLDISHNEG